VARRLGALIQTIHLGGRKRGGRPQMGPRELSVGRPFVSRSQNMGFVSSLWPPCLRCTSAEQSPLGADGASEFQLFAADWRAAGCTLHSLARLAAKALEFETKLTLVSISRCLHPSPSLEPAAEHSAPPMGGFHFTRQRERPSFYCFARTRLQLPAQRQRNAFSAPAKLVPPAALKSDLQTDY